MGIHRACISRLLTRVKLLGEEEGVKNKPKSGRKPSFTEAQRLRLIKVCEEKPFLSAKALKKRAQMDFLSARTVQEILRKAGLGSHRSTKKPFLTDAMMEKRVELTPTGVRTSGRG